MNPLLDQILVAAVILGAVAYFIVRPILRRRRGKAGCASDCGCASNKAKP